MTIHATLFATGDEKPRMHLEQIPSSNYYDKFLSLQIGKLDIYLNEENFLKLWRLLNTYHKENLNKNGEFTFTF